MEKIICSISFYAAFTINFILIISNSFWTNLIGVILMIIMYKICKHIGSEMMTEILGINWLQKKFKNNVVIMDMTNE